MNRTKVASTVGLIAIAWGTCLGCSGDGKQAAGTIDGPLLVSHNEAVDAMAAEVSGRVTMTGDCLVLGTTPVVWPEGTTWDRRTGAVRLPSGELAQLGAEVTGGGGYYTDLDAVADLYGPLIAEAARPCLGKTREVAVFNPGSQVLLHP